jgi:choline dehydrogenase
LDHPVVDVPFRPNPKTFEDTRRHFALDPPAAQVLFRAPDGKHGAQSWDLMLGPWLGPNHAGISIMQTAPQASGAVRQVGSKPDALPVIEHQFAALGSDDLESLRVGVELALMLGTTGSCAALAAPDPGLLDAREAGQLVEWIRQRIVANHHLVGTCAMGPAGDVAAVVDINMRVHGVDNLYVVDGSIFPSIPRANVHLTVLGVAERAAALFTGGQSRVA